MAQDITVDRHPPMVAVFNAQGMPICEIADQVHSLIHHTDTSAVVVLRDSQTLAQSAAIIKPQMKPQGRGPIGISNFYFGLSGRPTETELGPDFNAFSEFVRHFGKVAMDIRSIDGANGIAHIDSGSQASDLETSFMSETEKRNRPEFGITMTMSSHGGGTGIVKTSRDDFVQVTDSARTEPVWQWKEEGSQVESARVWRAPDGAFVAMKSKVWEAPHRPCVHISPPRKSDKDPNERVVGVAFVCGKK